MEEGRTSYFRACFKADIPLCMYFIEKQMVCEISLKNITEKKYLFVTSAAWYLCCEYKHVKNVNNYS